MGAAGISCSTSEMSAKGETGMTVDLDKVPLREKGMSAYEIMLSESQERMLFIIEKGKEDIAKKICTKWDVPITQIGEVTDTKLLKIFRNGKQVCEIPSECLVLGGGAPQIVRESIEPEYLKDVRFIDERILNAEINYKEVFEKLLSSPNIASKRWVYEQYDSQVRTNTVSIRGDAAVLRLKELPGKGIASSTDSNSKFVYLNPYRGAMIAVAEAARNCACVGAEPVAITNCLNFGNPYDKEVYWTFKEAIRGMGDACRALNTPVTGGNVSFHNESRNRAIYPTPTIGMLGLIEDMSTVVGAGFVNEGDAVYLLGKERNEIGGSEYLKQIHGFVAGDAPELDIKEEINLQKLILTAIRNGVVKSAHDCSEGGLAICLAEKAVLSKDKLGAKIELQGEISPARLFGESQSRIIVSLDPNKAKQLEEMSRKLGIECKQIGTVQKDNFEIVGCLNNSVENLIALYENALPKIMK